MPLVWEFPIKGKDTNFARRDQPPGTTPDCLNVLAYDPSTGRSRGGQRPGTTKLYTSQLGGGAPVQSMAQAAFELNTVGGVVLNQQNIEGTFSGSTSEQFSYTIPSTIVSWNWEMLATWTAHAIPGGDASPVLLATDPASGTKVWSTTLSPTGTTIQATGATSGAAVTACNTAIQNYILAQTGSGSNDLYLLDYFEPVLVLANSSTQSLGSLIGFTGGNALKEWSNTGGQTHAWYGGQETTNFFGLGNVNWGVAPSGGGSSWTATATWIWFQNVVSNLPGSDAPFGMASGGTTGIGVTWSAATSSVAVYDPLNPAYAAEFAGDAITVAAQPADAQIKAYSTLASAPGNTDYTPFGSLLAPDYDPSLSIFSVTSTNPVTTAINETFDYTSGDPLHSANANWQTRVNLGSSNFDGTINSTVWPVSSGGGSVLIDNFSNGNTDLDSTTAMWTPSLAALGGQYEFQITFTQSGTVGSQNTLLLGFGLNASALAADGWYLLLAMNITQPTLALYTSGNTLLKSVNVDAFQLPQDQEITVFVTVNGTGLTVQVGTLNYLTYSLNLPGTPSYQLGFGANVPTGGIVEVVNFLAQSLPGNGARRVQLITVCDGNVYQGDGYSPGQSASVQLTAGGTGVLLAGSVPQMASADGNVYISDGYNYVQLDLATATCSTMTADAGTLPPQCPLMCIWRGSLVMAGQIGNAQNWYMSAIGDYTNFDYSEEGTSPTSAIAGNAGNQYGKIGDPIVALIPLNDDILLFGCDSQFFAFVGDPRYNGVVDHFIQGIGIYGPNAWCFDPVGTLYFVGTGGFYRLAKGSTIPENLSNRVLPSFFQQLDPEQTTITLMWDQDRFGCWICAVPTTSTGAAGVNIFWDQRTGGYFPQQLPDGQGPMCGLVYFGDRPDDRALLLGGRDGYVRSIQVNPMSALSDDGVAISSFVLLGPARPIDDLNEVKTLAADFYTGQDVAGFGYNFGYTLQAAPDFYNAAFNPAVTTVGGPITGQGRIPKDRQARIRGGSIVMKIANNTPGTTWDIERVIMTLQKGAPQR